MGVYDYMYLVSRERYQQLVSSGSAAATSGSGTDLTGDVQSSKITNIEVSEGGTVVVNDKNKDGSRPESSDPGPAGIASSSIGRTLPKWIRGAEEASVDIEKDSLQFKADSKASVLSTLVNRPTDK